MAKTMNELAHKSPLILEHVKTWVGRTTSNGRKWGIALRGQKNYAAPTNEDLGQTSNWSKLVAAYLPVARLTILDHLVIFKHACSLTSILGFMNY